MSHKEPRTYKKIKRYRCRVYQNGLVYIDVVGAYRVSTASDCITFYGKYDETLAIYPLNCTVVTDVTGESI